VFEPDDGRPVPGLLAAVGGAGGAAEAACGPAVPRRGVG